ncbi:MAG: hypothetical protein WEA35_05540 [Candidatus Nanopelagicales bacterium]
MYTIMMVVIFMFGFLLYRGEYLPTPLVSLLSMGLDALSVVGFILLFFGKSAQWVKSHTDSS